MKKFLCHATNHDLTIVEVRTLVNEFKPAGSYEVSWDGKDNAGQRMPSGMYLYRMESQSSVQTRKMVLLQ